MWRRFLSFNEQFTPAFIHLFYSIGLVFIGLVSLVAIFGAFYEGVYVAGVVILFVGLFGFLALRMVCEVVLAIFQILENIEEMNRKLGDHRPEEVEKMKNI